MNYAKHVSVKGPTPQSEPIPGSKQVANNAGGFSYALDSFGRLERFLILGSEGGTYYVNEKKLTKDNAKCVLDCAREDGKRTVDLIEAISVEGRAPKNDAAIFALALIAKLDTNPVTRKLAFQAMPKVCRTGTHLFTFAEYCNELGGWGRGQREAIANWYNNKDVDQLAYQLVKYQQRNGWSHKDLLRLSHAVPYSDNHNWLFKWAVKGEGSNGIAPIVEAFEEIKQAKDLETVVRLVGDFNLPREAIPTQWLKEKAVWETLLGNKMPITAMIRNLATMTRIGLLEPFSAHTSLVVDAVTNPEILKKGRVHPLAILNALVTYKSGRSEKGSNTWVPTPMIVEALDQGFYAAFGAVEPTGKNLMLAIDISGSMDGNMIAGTSLDARMAAAAMALVTANVEKNYLMCGFDTSFSVLDISPKMRLDQVVRYMESLRMGGTDCALPMLTAARKQWDVDAFVTYTDSETWAGAIHPSQALKKYRQQMNKPNAANVVVGLTATDITIADPNDARSLDVVGFDMAAPQVISDFIKGA